MKNKLSPAGAVYIVTYCCGNITVAIMNTRSGDRSPLILVIAVAKYSSTQNRINYMSQKGVPVDLLSRCSPSIGN